MRVIQIRVQNGCVLDILGLEDGELAHIFDADLANEAGLDAMPAVEHPQWGLSVRSTYNPRLQEPWR